MDRQGLIEQVKAEYARIADWEGHVTNPAATSSGGSPEGYYEKLLDLVIHRIESGAFDGFGSGREIVEAVANNHGKWGISL